jgi:hypothetical protein
MGLFMHYETRQTHFSGFNGFYALSQTAEAVRTPAPHSYTPLKQGVNDKMRSLNHLVCEMFGLPLAHFGARGFENLSFAQCQTLDAVRGYFIQDRVYLLADELGRRQVIRNAFDWPFPKGLPAGTGLNQFAARGG